MKTNFPTAFTLIELLGLIVAAKIGLRGVDLLKPETGAVVPMLLALEPGYRSILSRVATLALAASKHRLAAAALPSFGGDISSEMSGLDGFGDDMGGAAFGADISSSGPAGNDPLDRVLAEALGESPQAFLAALARHRNWKRAMDPPPV